jgi:uncharacterized membrane protein
MNTKIARIFEYLYIAMAVFSIYLVFVNWNLDRNKAYLFMLFAVVAIFMFFFKRKFRKKMYPKDNTK